MADEAREGGPAALLALGERFVRSEWPDYVQRFGLKRDDIPELVRIAADDALSDSDGESVEVWAPLHAWRSLAQLGAAEAVEPLLGLLHRVDDNDDDWVGEELPRVFGMLGPTSLEPVAAYLADSTNPLWARAAAGRALVEIGARHPESRTAAVLRLAQQIERCEELPTLNGSLIANLLDLQAIEALPAMRKAFERGVVDPFVAGDLEQVEIVLGVRKRRTTPEPVDPTMARWREMLAPLPKKKVGRNEPCPCGSRLKYKKCCLNKPDV